jgi:hypothetical protein
MATEAPISRFQVVLGCGAFIVEARSLQAAILRAQADALDSGTLAALMEPVKVEGVGVSVERITQSPVVAAIKPQIETGLPPSGQEKLISAQEVMRLLAERRGKKGMHSYTLNRAIRFQGLPARPNPFGRGHLFYWSEVEAWLATPPKEQVRRGPGRPPKYVK